MKIPFIDLNRVHDRLRDNLFEEWSKIIDSSSFIRGEIVNDFANALKEYVNSEYVIPCGNGTDALQLSLMSLDLSPGDAIAVPAFTYISSVEVIALLQLKPVLVDVDPDTFNIDMDDLEEKLGKRNIKAVIPVHLYGLPVDMERLLKLKSKYGFYIVEDNAQALGSTVDLDDKKNFCGTIGEFGTNSFFPTKILGGMGDGGAVFSSDEELGRRCEMIANHGQSKKYYFEKIGVNSRLDTIQAALLDLKLKEIDYYIEERRRVAENYTSRLSSFDFLQTPKEEEHSLHVYHQYTIKVMDGNRDKLKSYLSDNGIPSVVYYPLPIHEQKAYEYLGNMKGQFPVSEKLSTEVLSIPIFPAMTQGEQDYVIETIQNFKI